VFDSLSDLQVAWSTDLMMGNFFCVTCPYLFELDTVALFPVLRGHHDFATIARIQETTQLFIDVYSDEKDTFIHPIKVWNRYLPDMYMPYRLNDDNELESLTGSVDLADYYNLIHNEQRGTPSRILTVMKGFSGRPGKLITGVKLQTGLLIK